MSSASSEHILNVFDSIADYAILTTDVAGRITSANRGVENLLGYTEEELLGRSAELIFTPEDRANSAHEQEQDLARSSGRAKDDRWHVCKDGSRIWVNGIMTELRDEDGEFRGFVKVMRDRTDEKVTQDSLLVSEARYRSLLNDVIDVFTVGVFILDAEFNVVWLNRAGARYFGLDREDVVGRNKRELRPILARRVVEPADFVDRLEASQRQNVQAERFEIHLAATADSDECWDECWLEHRSEPIRSGPLQGGRIEHYYDITERKRTAQELVRAHDELESQVAERTADLLALNDELESFNYSVSHDLRAPLRGLTGFSQIIVEEYGHQLGERGRGYLERVSSAAERMGELIDALLALSRVSRWELSLGTVDLSQLAREIAEALRERQPERKVTFDIEPGVEAEGDETLLRLAIENLILNAWRFTRDNDDARISFGAEREVGGPPVFYVEDNGAGFDMSFADKLFVPFQRLHSPVEFSGTGMGLATVRRIVQRHGGAVWGEGEVGRGAVFRFTLGPSEARAAATAAVG